MSFPLEQRGSPVCLPLPVPIPAPRPANRIVSLGDSDSSAVKPSQIVPSCLCGGRVPLESQSSDDSVSRMTYQCVCPRSPPRWLPVSCRACASDSDIRTRNCVCSHMEPSVVSVRYWATRPRARPRAQCSRKIVSDKGRKCRHTSCQRVANADSESKPVKSVPVNVIDVLHRDQRTVCVSSTESPSADDFERISYRRSRYGKCDLQIRFSMQRFCSAVLCGLLLLTTLRPQLSMAAPVPSRELTASEDNHDASSSTPDINEMLKNLNLEIDLTLGHFKEKIRNQYCKDVFYLDKECPYYDINVTAFKFIAIPKKLGDAVATGLFDTEEQVDEALRNTLHNFQAYRIHLQKIKENQIPDERNLSNQYDVLKEHIRKLHEELLNLMKLRGLNPVPSPTLTDSEIDNLHNTDTSGARAVHWAILVEVINGVEYLSQMIPYLSPTHQSTKL